MVQSLGLFSSTAMVIGSMIGSGIFIVDADIARGTNSPALFLGAWVVTAILTMIGALSYGELAAMMPKAGGQYIYLRESLGPLWGFLYGWTLFLVIQTGTIAAVCVAFGKFLGVFFPSVSTTHCSSRREAATRCGPPGVGPVCRKPGSTACRRWPAGCSWSARPVGQLVSRAHSGNGGRRRARSHRPRRRRVPWSAREAGDHDRGS